MKLTGSLKNNIPYNADTSKVLMRIIGSHWVKFQELCKNLKKNKNPTPFIIHAKISQNTEDLCSIKNFSPQNFVIKNRAILVEISIQRPISIDQRELFTLFERNRDMTSEEAQQNEEIIQKINQ